MSIIHDVNTKQDGKWPVIAAGDALRVVVTYTYNGTSPGKVVIAGEIPDASGEQCVPTPPFRECKSAEEKQEATFSLKVSVPAGWNDGEYTVSVAATLFEGTSAVHRFPLRVAGYVVKE